MTAKHLTSAQLLDAAIAKLADERGLPFDQGGWTFTVHASNGKVRRTVAEQRTAKIAFNRDQLDGTKPPAEMGESAA